MESLGKYLKREREFRNISLREIARKIRVREHFLRAIEEDQYHLLPSATYAKGFLLAYAKTVGLDPKEVILRYEIFLKGEPISSPEISPEKKILWNKKHLWIVGGVIGASLIASYVLYPSKRPSEFISEKQGTDKILPSPSSPQIAGTTLVTEEKLIALQFKAIEETWVRIQVDGQPEQEMTLKPGEGSSHRALKQIQLLIGNAGGLELTFNEKRLGKPGKSGEVIVMIFTPQGVETKHPEKPKTP